MEDIAGTEIPDAVQKIMDQRATDLYEPLDPVTVGYSAGGVLQLIYLNGLIAPATL
mgnify:CR=1 FL=1|jgi:hypothetical protein